MPPPSRHACSLPIIGDDSAISAYSNDAVELVNGLGAVGETSLRTGIYDKFKKLGYSFRSLVHPVAIVAKDCVLGEGVQVMAGAVVNTGTKVADDVIINKGTTVDHDCIIESHVHLAPGVTVSGGVLIGTGAYIGVGAIVIQGVVIGDKAIVGAGAVVLKDVPAGVKVVGVPAKPL